jgi:DNA-binding NarL/FixJ family response regulator
MLGVAAKNNPLGTVTWGDITNLIKTIQGNIPAVNSPSKARLHELSDRDILFLRLIAEEKETEEIAKTMNLAKRTVETYRINLKTKLGAKNTVGLVLFAIKNGIVTVTDETNKIS